MANLARLKNVARTQNAVRAEDRAIDNRPEGWSAKEAQRAHRRSNAKSIGRNR